MKFKMLTDSFAGEIDELEKDGCFGNTDAELGIRALPSENRALSVKRTGNIAEIRYPTRAAFFRALTLLCEHSGDVKYSCTEQKRTDDLGYMIDCSRNAVYTVDTVKKIIRQISLMGYDYLMLYCEDTIDIPEYPLLGYMRASYTHAEIKEIVAYGKRFGIELVPCVQTLAHLNGLLKWKKHRSMADANDILLVGADETYAFIDTVIKNMREIFETDRIHIGMDEAFMLGRGKYITENGYKPQNEIFSEHLERVIPICLKNGFAKQIIWSTGIVEGIKIPESVTLAVWDYYLYDKDAYADIIKKAKALTDNIIFGDSAYRCTGFSSTMRHSVNVIPEALAACDAENIKGILVTAWGDCGAEGSAVQPLTVLQLHSEYAYSESFDSVSVDKRLLATAGISGEAILDFDYCNLLPGTDYVYAVNPGTALLYQDVLSGILDKHVSFAPDATDYLKKGVKLFDGYMTKYPEYAYAFKVQRELCRALASKWNMGVRVTQGYLEKNFKTLREIANDEIPETVKSIERLYEAFRAQWYCEAKQNGFEVHDIRLGGLIMRLKNVACRINEYCDGLTDKIEELETPRQFFDTREKPDVYKDWLEYEHKNYYTDCHLYHINATSNILSGN